MFLHITNFKRSDTCFQIKRFWAHEDVTEWTTIAICVLLKCFWSFSHFHTSIYIKEANTLHLILHRFGFPDWWNSPQIDFHSNWDEIHWRRKKLISWWLVRRQNHFKTGNGFSLQCIKPLSIHITPYVSFKCLVVSESHHFTLFTTLLCNAINSVSSVNSKENGAWAKGHFCVSDDA